ncbi:hypothetical protein SISNIDRAFT_450921 [Sistotremastrum niveocremeum HHB9708]|uniref:DASH complex subunit DAM1 n=1 Tax=Sistotremastrum niveocremeum HHB9708 TaxID=1314777 RepID=A0A164XT58_9AGAM|nr:hypothetical protein SISNIDRAFT_450921 [Sistotremastrum niveocremeum HHB9708]
MPEHRTPLRRLSRGSLLALSRSGSHQEAPYGLGFLNPALAELADEAEALQSNVQGLKELSESLKDFNEGFASYLYVLKMNAFVTEWHQMPTDSSFALAEQRQKRQEEEAAHGALEALQAAVATATSQQRDPGPSSETILDRTTYTDGNNSTFTTCNMTTAANDAPKKTILKKRPKPQLTAKEKRERGILLEKAVNCLPIEFRGSDPNLRRNAEFIIEALMESKSDDGLKITDMIRPDCNQAKVNKCLIALLSRKMVTKSSSSVGHNHS